MFNMGERIRDARLNKGLTQEKLAELLQVPPQIVSDWENGSDSRIDHVDIVKLARSLNTTADYLLGLSDSPSPRSKSPPDVRMIIRAGENITAEQRDARLKIARILFPDAFREETRGDKTEESG